MTAGPSSTPARPGPAPHPVLIVGAGPTGLALAHELARQGVALRIVDRGPVRPDGEGRANGLHSRTLEVIERYGLVDRVLGEALPLTAAETETDDGRPLMRLPSGFPGKPYPAVILNQSRIERILIEGLAERFGIEVERPVTLEGFTQDDDGVDAVLQHAAGERERARFAALAACDGGHSATRKALGLDFAGIRLEGAYVMDARARWARPVAPGVLRLATGPTGCVAGVDTPGGLVRLVAVLQEGDARARVEPPSVALMQSILDEHPGLGITIDDSVWASGFQIANRNVERLRHGRVVLLGDAAHIHSPMGGQGLNLGVQDAANLGWKLSLWWHGLADDSILDTFGPERLPVIRGVLRRTRATQRALLLRGRLAVRARNTLMRTVGRLPWAVNAARKVNEGYGVHYRASRLAREATTTARGPVRAGDLMPDAAGLATADAVDRRLYAVLAEDARHTLLVVAAAAGGPERARRLAEQAHARFGAVLRALVVLPPGQTATNRNDVVDARGDLARALGRAPALVLVRPDTYVGLRADALDQVAAHVRDDLGIRVAHEQPDADVPDPGTPSRRTI